MSDFKRILVPTDFGPAANRALDLAIWLHSKLDAKITLMHAYLVPVGSYGYADSLLWPAEDLAAAAKKELDSALAKARERCPTMDAVLARGEPWEQILNAAKACDADLIVMGTHGRRWMSRIFLGSEAEKVVRLSPIPVMTVRSPEEQKAKESSTMAAT